MHPVSPRAEAVRAALLAAAAATVIVAFAPPGGDSAAHLYRTLLVRDGVHVWDNFWYAGQYPFASYSLLYYVPATVVGNVPLVVAAVVASAALFASLAVREWGASARWPARAFGLAAAGPLFTGTYSYALGLAAALAALRLLQGRRTWAAVVCAALSLAGVLALSALGAALAFRSDAAGPIAPFFVLWGLVSVAAYVVPSPFGDNLARLRELAFPLVLLAAVLARFRPRPIAIAALAVALVYNLSPDLRALPKRVDDARTAGAAYWAPAVDFLHRHRSPEYRVEVVPTFGHWEAYWIPRAGLPLARGWYRQLDIAQNPELYRTPLAPTAYRRWLRKLGVRYVLLPRARLGPLGAEREAALLRSGAAGLRPVRRLPDWTIYELPRPSPLLTGPAHARLLRFGHEGIAGRVDAAGTYKLRVRYTPLWRVDARGVCLERAPDGMTRLVAARPGRFVLSLPERPGTLLRSAFGGRSAGC